MVTSTFIQTIPPCTDRNRTHVYTSIDCYSIVILAVILISIHLTEAIFHYSGSNSHSLLPCPPTLTLGRNPRFQFFHPSSSFTSCSSFFLSPQASISSSFSHSPQPTTSPSPSPFPHLHLCLSISRSNISTDICGVLD